MHESDDLPAWQLAQAAQRKAQRRRAAAVARAGRRADAGAPPLDPPCASPLRRPTLAQRQGRQAEQRALRLLRAAGLLPLACNLSCRAGEIDLVMRDGAVLVFVEVRRRASDRYGGAAASVGAAKQARIARAAAFFLPWLARVHWQGRVPACRFDVVADEPQGLRWIRNAFELR